MDKRLAIVLALVAGVGCSYAGTGGGVLKAAPAPSSAGGEPKGNVSFAWKSGSDPSRGSIEAKLPDGRTFSGTYLQLTDTATYQSYGPYWHLWSSNSWAPMGPWYHGPSGGFLTHYQGQALAQLKSPDGVLMRCQFVLREPPRGLAGGGIGDCQLSTQESVFGAELSPAS